MTSTLAIAFGFSSLLAGVVGYGKARSPFPQFNLRLHLRAFLGLWPWGQAVAAPNPLIGLGLALVLLGLSSCGGIAPVVPRQIVLKQTWEIESGDRVAGQLVTGSLGDISVRLQGTRLRAPFAGQVELASRGFHCIYFSTPEVPAYLFRYCGVRQPRLGTLQAGEVMGRGGHIHFATLRRQPDGAWAIVEPSDRVLERSLNQPSPGFSF